jgi:tetratricopeptide (TPR) repeat protein
VKPLAPARTEESAGSRGRQAPSDFPAALGALDAADLPVVSADLPAAKAPPGGVREGGSAFARSAPFAPPARPAAPAARAPAANPPAKAPAIEPLPSSAIDDLDFDLPALADLRAGRAHQPDLPVVRSKAAVPATNAKPAAAQRSLATETPFDLDLPVNAAASVKGGSSEAKREAMLSDLPVVATHDLLPELAGEGLPVIAAGLPMVSDGRGNLPVPAASLPARVDASAHLPSPAAALPIRAEVLPTLAAALPVRHEGQTQSVSAAGGMGFGEIELPTVGDPSPSSSKPPPAAAPQNAESTFGFFGEIDLPHESPPSSPRNARAPTSSGPPVGREFTDLELDDRPRSSRPRASASVPSPAVRSDAPKAAGGMTFGEVDIGGSEAPSIGVDTAPKSFEASPVRLEPAASARVRDSSGVGLQAGSSRPQAGSSSQTRSSTPRSSKAPPRKRSVGKTIAAVVLGLSVVAGGSLQVTPYGAFGYVYLSDLAHAGEYTRATVAAALALEKGSAPDTYDAAKASLDALNAAQSQAPRAHALAAYAAFADFAVTLRFGADPSRPSRGETLYRALPRDKPLPYADAAGAARTGASGAIDPARKGIGDAARVLAPGDPMQLDLALVAGELALAAHDGASATASFKKALALANDARAHFGLARALDFAGDAAGAKEEIEATLAASPAHPGALILRAQPRSGAVDPGQALADLATVIDGPSRTKASPAELSRAYAARAWVSLERGAATFARDAFARAVALDPRNVDALNGQGRLFLNEERATEALARFDTALGIDSASPETIANDAEAKIALERLADAKQQLTAARAQFPKSIPILVLLGRAEQHLGNSDAAEADLRAATALVDPARADAVRPYVALSKLLSERGHVADARAALEEAKKKLPDTPALERAFGEINELQGDCDGAIARYRSAIAKDPKDATSHFRLGVALRRTRKFDEAGTELDKVAAVDKEYPGLSLERGLLFEESGDVQKAIEEFNGALAKAPDDPDLELRVGAAYVAIGRADEALAVLRKVVDKRPTSAEAQHSMGRALMLQSGAQGDALRFLKRAVELDPNRAEFHVYVAWAANDATPAQLELARDEIDRALAIDTLSAEAYWQRGVLERMEGAVDDAIKDENRALGLRPSRYEARATLAECYEDKNQDAAALTEWAHAIAGDAEPANTETTRHPFWRFRYGKLLMDHGGPALALAQLLPAVNAAEAMASKPGWLAPLEFLTAEALRKTGKKADAIEHYKRFLEIAPVNSPDRLDAQQSLSALGASR